MLLIVINNEEISAITGLLFPIEIEELVEILIIVYELAVTIAQTPSLIVIGDAVGTVIVALEITVIVVPLISEMVIVDSVGIVILAFVIWGRNAIVKYIWVHDAVTGAVPKAPESPAVSLKPLIIPRPRLS